MKRLKQLVVIAGVALVSAAVAQQMRKPPEERDWTGNVVGVPYDFRWPTVERVREAYWNPDDERIFTKRVLGMGWGINFAALLRNVRCCCRPEQEQEQA